VLGLSSRVRRSPATRRHCDEATRPHPATSPQGRRNVPRNPAEFPALLEMSTYHQIRDGVAYPAVMLMHGMNDPRVDVWHRAKAAARLQEAAG